MLRSGVRTALATIVLSVGLGWAAPADADLDIDINFFHSGLSPYGRWVDHDRFGTVWIPTRVGHNWRPYTVGRWVYVDGWGWLWAEAEPFGWATYHYGRWYFDRRFGWAWIPGYEWAPAWVSWRYGSYDRDRWIGWAPLPPRGYRLDDSRWIFTPQHRFLAPRVRDYVVLPSRTVVLARNVPVTGRVEHHRDRWVNHGVDVHEIERVVEHKVERVKLRDVEDAQSAKLDKDTKHVAVYRPRVHQAPDAKARKWDEERAKLTGTTPVHGDRTVRTEPSGKASRSEPKAPKAAPAPARTDRSPTGKEPRAAAKQKPQPEPLRAPSGAWKAEPQRRPSEKSKSTPRVETPRTDPYGARSVRPPSNPERSPQVQPSYQRAPKPQTRPERAPKQPSTRQPTYGHQSDPRRIQAAPGKPSGHGNNAKSRTESKARRGDPAESDAAAAQEAYPSAGKGAKGR